MSAREWKPGDVAMIRTREHGELVGLRTAAPLTPDGKSEFFNVAGFSYATRREARPLVVIDPEDREQVERLAHAYAMNTTIGSELNSRFVAALRSLIAPPKPDEPTGLGAVVEDATGVLWVLVSDRKRRWQQRGSTNRLHWDEIDRGPVKVLSEGVTP